MGKTKPKAKRTKRAPERDFTNLCDDHRAEEFATRLAAFMNDLDTELYPDAPGYAEYLVFSIVGEHFGDWHGLKRLDAAYHDIVKAVKASRKRFR